MGEGVPHVGLREVGLVDISWGVEDGWWWLGNRLSC